MDKERIVALMQFLDNARKRMAGSLFSAEYEESGQNFILSGKCCGRHQIMGQVFVASKNDDSFLWVVNYRIRFVIENSSLTVEQVCDFRGRAYEEISLSHPLGGKRHFLELEWAYFNSPDEGSTAENFSGRERICFQGRPVFECKYHGGIVK